MKSLIKKFIPKSVLSLYHKFLAIVARFAFGNPSEKMIVIGVTGTNGKSSTVKLIAKALASEGAKVGYTSTSEFQIGDKEWLNKTKMTMLGRFQLQKLLKKMVDAGCRYAVVEVSSQGVEQFRHFGINFDYAIFTNLTPEHIEAHGGFENYKKAKGKFFKFLTLRPRKKINGQEIKKVMVVNRDDEHSDYFLSFPADKKLIFSAQDKLSDVFAENIKVSTLGTSFSVKGLEINLRLLGKFNVYNSLPAIAIGLNEGLDLEKIKAALEAAKVIPGRMELIDEGQPFSVIVDYAPEPYSLAKLYETLDLMQKNKLIHVLGSCGGGRDVARRPILGKMAGEKADIVIVTNEDPYDDDPQKIIDEVAAGAIGVGKKLNENLFKILDRKEAIAKAMNLAGAGDLVVLTGKGSEQAIVVKNNKKMPWDEREAAREVLRRRC
ncbi:MAG TPA: UDP-N-acetylmuramoyl-L-alanyl-D-glutamate--2,6-diaminopimelate ligase [Candidatus Bipolaricaulota bacterium]|nr:UDP-N-acetylmuramoyl-L-alanyl-D-glutamate--2,6-diaminopimelate ligase [Candidatus Bipolaricaulota bacterium]